MDTYDPNHAPDPTWWKALDESEQIYHVKQYHKRKRIKLPNANLHAGFHAIVENQIALGDELNVSKTLDRLLAEGLDRHDAVHAIGSVLAAHMHRMMSKRSSGFSKDEYASDLDALTAETWGESGQES